MAPSAIIESVVAVTQADTLGPDIYQNAQAVFGGLLSAQAKSAASATVPPNFHTYSSHSSFIKPVTLNAGGRVFYHVERTADGRAYTTRLVHATQGDKDNTCVYIAVISFQSRDKSPHNALNYGTPLPDLSGVSPDDIPEGLNQKMPAASASPDGPFKQLDSDGEPFDWRPLRFALTNEPYTCRSHSFARSLPLSTTSAAVNLAALAYMSDQVLFSIAIYANPDKVGERAKNVTMGATLSHNVSFHDPAVKVDEWMVVERETSWGGGGRVLIHERIWDLKSGSLVMTCMQEALIRLRDSKI
ncbi:Acyl-coenzyme A thioesterase 8 [Daldinia childiae]|uniref:Acyl-coenzyme A thioesterase 8 n=1 Tax=Daldinia childiae TaxID=326645 RepID=UPI001445AFA3|nr:Acyl-coenzyme A thioesterase 8 [Daldinia childiae]KAF3066432.1 Acyl-coenzyme A thioesterase 8 [Daldinia childiae]